MTLELKRCPFCRDFADELTISAVTKQVKCRCGARGPLPQRMSGEELWNHRAATVFHAQVVAIAREAITLAKHGDYSNGNAASDGLDEGAAVAWQNIERLERELTELGRSS